MEERKAAEIMTTPVVTVGQDALRTDAIKLLLR